MHHLKTTTQIGRASQEIPFLCSQNSSPATPFPLEFSAAKQFTLVTQPTTLSIFSPQSHLEGWVNQAGLKTITAAKKNYNAQFSQGQE